MKITDFQKANEIRKKISSVIGSIGSIENIIEVNLITSTRHTIVVKDLRRSLTENRVNEALINCQANFVATISNILEDYKKRLEEEFDKI